MLASIKVDTSMIERKTQKLLEMLPEHIPNQVSRMLSELVDNVVLVNNSPAIAAGGSFDVICFADFDGAIYNKVLSAARALKVSGITH